MHEHGPTVVFSGGGTGGHLYPALALADAIRAERPGLRVVFLGARRGIESRVLPERGEKHLLLPVRGMARGGGLGTNLGVPWALLRSLGRTVGWFRDLDPELVVVTGGYAGAPAGIVAALMGIPLALQEQNAVPGLTTRLLARRANEIHVAYPEVAARLPRRARARVRVSGNPVRPPVPRGRAAARTALGLDPDRATVLVVGGS
ncbi:MAG TPA: glycosyltransferase, partial [Longimicrobiales bacterium]|nr:glycosyltransferase [Longimicrobiales bacterium]